MFNRSIWMKWPYILSNALPLYRMVLINRLAKGSSVLVWMLKKKIYRLWTQFFQLIHSHLTAIKLIYARAKGSGWWIVFIEYHSSLLSLFLAVLLNIRRICLNAIAKNRFICNIYYFIEPCWMLNVQCSSLLTNQLWRRGLSLFMTSKTKFVKALNKWILKTFIHCWNSFFSAIRIFLVWFSPVVRTTHWHEK